MIPTGPPGSLPQRLERHFAKLATFGNQPDGSISRIAYSDEESAAMAYIRAQGEALGLEGGYDPVGNLILRMPGPAARRLLVGSHLDSVPHGGNYDGAAGVVAGLEALRRLLDERDSLERAVDLVVWRGEEYTFNAVYKGSAAAFGKSDPHILHNVYRDVSLRNAMLQQRHDPTFIDEQRPSLEQDYIDSIDGFLELHIEQGARLETEGKDLGVVSGIAGDRRFVVVLEGTFDHSGATPMGVRYRRDVNLAMAYIQTRIDEIASFNRAAGHEFTQTVGIVNADPEIDRRHPEVHDNSVTKVSGLGYFTLDIMSVDDSFMDRYSAEVHRAIWKVARDFRVNANIELTDSSAGVQALDPEFARCLEECTVRRGYSCLTMPSGAGHDAAMVAGATNSEGRPIPVGMLFVPCRHGVSHSKEEHVGANQLAKGVDVLGDTLRELAASRTDRSTAGQE
jgi:N-carbamoyl-L-amino-acid hydrolase